MKKIFASLAAFTMLMASCTKDSSSSSSVNYQPSTAGSTWTYHVENKINAAASFDYTLTSITKDSVINGKTYHVYSSSAGGNEYYYHSGTDYYQVASLTGVDQGLELLYLKDQAVGTSWSESKTISITGVGSIPTTFNYTIEDKLASYTVGSTTYSNVLKVKVTLVPTGINNITQNLEFYYAPNIGRVQSDIQLSVPLAAINVNTETTLTSSTIVK